MPPTPPRLTPPRLTGEEESDSDSPVDEDDDLKEPKGKLCTVQWSFLFLESLHYSSPMLDTGSSSVVDLCQVFMGTGVWQDGAD